MTVLKVITGDLEECEKEIHELEQGGMDVNVVYVRPLIETPHLLGSGTGHQLPKVKLWMMMLQYE